MNNYSLLYTIKRQQKAYSYDINHSHRTYEPRQAGGNVHTKLNGEAETFEIESNGITAVIAYDTEIVEDKGDYWTAPSWSIEDETVAIEAVYDEDGNEDKEAADWLKKMLN